MAFRLLWRYVVGKTKTVIKNYNVTERAEKVMEHGKKVAPLHPGTEAKFQVLVKGNPEFKNELQRKSADLLDRLKIVKVTSEGTLPNPVSTKPLPQAREAVEVPLYGYEEPKNIPEGKCSLRQALGFITQHQNDPQTHSIKSIAENHSMKEVDIENIIKHFRVFELYISRDGKSRVAKSSMESIGIGKVVEPMFKSKFAHLEPNRIPRDTKENK